MVIETNQPYAYAGDDPVDGADPLGLHDCGWTDPFGCVGNAGDAVGHALNSALPVVHEVANVIALGASICAAFTSETVVGGFTCGTIALGAGAVTAGTGAILHAEGRESGTEATIDVLSAGLSGLGSLSEAAAGVTRGFANDAEVTSLLREAEMNSANLFGKVVPWISSEWWAGKAAFWGATSSQLSSLSRILSAAGFGVGVTGNIVGSCK
jgi:hypothetical protein